MFGFARLRRTFFPGRLYFVCLLTFSGITLGQENGPSDVIVVVKEDSDAILPCSLGTKENIVAAFFSWRKDEKEVFLYDAGMHYNNGRSGQDGQFRGRTHHFQEQVKHGNASILIKNTTVSDSGNYSCIFPRLSPRQTFRVQLVVELKLKDRSGETSGAAPKPCFTIVAVSDLGVLLQCDVKHVFPKPALRWFDDDGAELPSDERLVSQKGDAFSIGYRLTVTKTGRYSCIVTQDDIGHETKADITVSDVLFKDTCSKAVIWLTGSLVGAFSVVTLLILLVAVKVIKINHNPGFLLKKKTSYNNESGPCSMNGLVPCSAANGTTPLYAV